MDGWLLSAGIFSVTTALCGWLGYYTMFNSFGAFDDEGYLLLSLKTFVHHGGLYTHVTSSFGPFYFEVFSTIFTWLPVTLDNARVVSIIVVLLASVGFGIAILMFTRNLLAGVGTQFGTFVLLIHSFIDESMHPLILVSLTLAITLIGLALVARGQRSSGCVVLGATVAALVLTVVNVGAFAVVAMLFIGLALAPPIPELRLPRRAAAALFVASPFLLMLVAGGHLTEAWALKYSFIVASAAAGVVIVTLDRDSQGLVQKRDVSRFLLGAGVLGGVVIVIALLSGTRPADLVSGIFINPAHFANAFTTRIRVPVWIDAWGVVGLAGAILYRRHRHERRDSAGLVDGYVRTVVGVFILYLAIAYAQVRPHWSVSFSVALPLLFLAAAPPFGATDSERIARTALVTLAVLESLLAYPVAGAQLAWSSLLMVPAGMLCLYDGMHELRPALTSANRRGRRSLTGLLAMVLITGLAWLAWVFVGNLYLEAKSYYDNTPVTLPGSDMIRLAAPQAGILESLSHAVRVQCSTFVTFPAMDSLYFWTEESPPTDWFNVWFYTLDAALQKQIVHRIERSDRYGFCVVDNPRWSAFWAYGHVLPQLPLARLAEKFRRENNPPAVFGGYRLFSSHGPSS